MRLMQNCKSRSLFPYLAQNALTKFNQLKIPRFDEKLQNVCKISRKLQENSSTSQLHNLNSSMKNKYLMLEVRNFRVD